MYYGGCCNYGINAGNGSWLWIVLIVFIILFLFRGNDCSCNGCSNR